MTKAWIVGGIRNDKKSVVHHSIYRLLNLLFCICDSGRVSAAIIVVCYDCGNSYGMTKGSFYIICNTELQELLSCKLFLDLSLGKSLDCDDGCVSMAVEIPTE